MNLGSKSVFVETRVVAGRHEEPCLTSHNVSVSSDELRCSEAWHQKEGLGRIWLKISGIYMYIKHEDYVIDNNNRDIYTYIWYVCIYQKGLRERIRMELRKKRSNSSFGLSKMGILSDSPFLSWTTRHEVRVRDACNVPIRDFDVCLILAILLRGPVDRLVDI